MNNTLGIIFAYDSNPDMKCLTERRTVSSIPFGGRYRIIDFMLSNMVHSGITDVGVVLQESYQSLLDHLGAGKDWDLNRKREGLRLLPPFGYGNRLSSGFIGQLDALSGVTDYIKRAKRKYVLLSEGNLISNIDLDEMFTLHTRRGADITAACSSSVI
jgi:glucose-1-phosphate adenylyltransferase